MPGFFVTVGGIEQWVEVHGQRPEQDRPVMLYLHGGPGASSRPAVRCWEPWTDHFTVVHWDQRGTGRTLQHNGEAACGPLTIDRMVRDGLDLSEQLCRTMGTARLLLLGHSWGSVLGVHMASRRPDLFCAYVGTGQLVNKQKNEEVNLRQLLAQARQLGREDALRSLGALERPVHTQRSNIAILREWGDRLSVSTGDSVVMTPNPPNPDFTPEDRLNQQRGRRFSGEQLFEEVSALALDASLLQFDVPMLFLHGTADQQTPFELVEAYVARLAAPFKVLVPFEQCHHFLAVNRPADFMHALLTHAHHLRLT
ncbi:MAG: alpha/beta hydrolase [Cytophagales bacterium]|nr:alpha/beta hydrolase [Rhizobacter sp.]